jgi:uncharacterized protein (TIGR02217 family)
MLKELEFPSCISYGSVFAEAWDINSIRTASGIEWREANIDRPLGRYTISLENATAAEYGELLKLWHAVNGGLHNFLFLNPTDYTSSTADNSNGSEIAFDDQDVAIANGAMNSYTLTKSYEYRGCVYRRPIRRIYQNNLLVGVDGRPVTNFKFDNSQGVLRFLQSIAPMQVDGSFKGNKITGADFSSLQPNDLVYVKFEGFTAGSSNPLRVVSSDNTSVTLERYSGSLLLEDYVGTVDIRSAVPPTGAKITAGFKYLTPVAFDMPALEAVSEAGMHESFFATVQNIALKEVIL